MVFNYIKLACRNLWKDRVFTCLNILGLSVAFCVATLLIISSLDELATDQFHEEKDNLYKVYATEQTVKGPKEAISRPIPFAPTLQNEVPGIEKISRHLEMNTLVSDGDKELILDLSYVDQDFLQLFTFPVLKGETDSPLAKKSSVVLTQKSANMLFGTDEVVGKTIMIQKENVKEPFTITAILKDIPHESSMGFHLLLAFDESPNYKENLNAWNSRNHSVYLKLSKGVTTQQFEERTRAFVAKHYKETIDDAKRDGVSVDVNGQYYQFRLFPFAESEFTSFKGGIANVSHTMPYIVLGIAILILFIASVNFINMSVAKSGQRLREIGMRKTLGASQSQLFIQLWVESIFIFTLSLVLGSLLGYGLLGDFQTLFRTEGSFETLLRPQILMMLFVTILLITIIAGGYPALLLSKLGTLKALKGKLEAKAGTQLRNTLIIIQFSIAILLISGTLVLSSQINYLRHKDLGFDKNNVVSFPFNGSLDSYTALNRLRNSLQNEPEVLSITAADNNLGYGRDGSGYTSVSGFDYEGRGLKTHSLVVDYDYIKTLGLELVAGRGFNRAFSTDSLSMVINETMAKEYGKENPLDVTVAIGDSSRYNVIGVVKDYNFRGLKRQVEPITMFMDNSLGYYYAFVQVDPKNAISAYDKIEKAWKDIEPNAPFLGSFLDENIDRTLKKEKVLTTIITSGSIVAIILSCIGLFAISMIMVNQRTKEIGVRKIVGASITGLMKLLLGDFIKLVILAFVIATPVAWWLSYKWLEEYSYKISLNFGFFVVAGLITLVIALLTIGYKTIKAALQNPVESLRTE
ncbi:ABC transporter permease [Psychroserpens ponticola]|uniref:ABC transporter permease n=1 Tax=Psychroserpens ponticola TaxID=2932268 RepID=A0ABY7S1I0_9FLAO|nr:ABC transporter permease [Psychroserpens ponticola]WCO02311.1 ABC transporter permease [Psychroserpens ponticola]